MQVILGPIKIASASWRFVFVHCNLIDTCLNGTKVVLTVTYCHLPSIKHRVRRTLLGVAAHYKLREAVENSKLLHQLTQHQPPGKDEMSPGATLDRCQLLMPALGKKKKAVIEILSMSKQHSEKVITCTSLCQHSSYRSKFSMIILRSSTHTVHGRIKPEPHMM